MNESFFEMFFRYMSKLIIIIPIMIVIVAVIIKGTHKNENNNTQSIPTETITPAKEEKLSTLSQLKESTIASKLKLKGTFVCDLDNSDKKVHLLVDNKQAYVEYKNSTIDMIGLLNKDCIYNWDKKTYKGVKTCGLGLIINMIENDSIIDLFNNPLVSSFVKGKEVELINLTSSCKETTKPNQSIFIIPTNVVFEEK